MLKRTLDYEPNPAQIEAFTAVSKMKERAAATEELTSQVFSTQVQNVAEHSYPPLLTTAAMEHRIGNGTFEVVSSLFYQLFVLFGA